LYREAEHNNDIMQSFDPDCYCAAFDRLVEMRLVELCQHGAQNAGKRHLPCRSPVDDYYAELVDELQRHGVGITLTGGETADVGDLVRTIIVDSTVAARIRRDQVIDNARISAGDVVVGLASSGRATYESSYNSGIGSNGLTCARHDTFGKALAREFPESFDPAMPLDLVYSGGAGLEDPVDIGAEGSIPAGKLVLSPTRTYAPIVKEILAAGLRDRIHGMIHCSGGAQTKVLHFVDGVHIVKDNLLPTPPVFRLIQRNSQTPWEEMYKVFNMGHRLELYTDQEAARTIIEISKSMGVEAQVIGRVEAASMLRPLWWLSESPQKRSATLRWGAL